MANKNKIKAIFFDIDGTFFDHKTVRVLDSTWEACRLLKENGYKVVLCTGRPKELAEDLPLLDRFPFDGFIGSNGALVLNEKMEPVYADAFSVEKASELFSIGKKYGILMQTIGKENFITGEPDETAEKSFENFHIARPQVKQYEGELLTNITALGDPKELMVLFQGVEGVRAFATSKYTLDFAKPNITKASGIAKLMEYWGYGTHDYMAFGDSMNDVEMLEEASLGVAMKNSDPDLFASADEVCAASWEDGIYQTLKTHGLI